MDYFGVSCSVMKISAADWAPLFTADTKVPQKYMHEQKICHFLKIMTCLLKSCSIDFVWSTFIQEIAQWDAMYCKYLVLLKLSCSPLLRLVSLASRPLIHRQIHTLFSSLLFSSDPGCPRTVSRENSCTPTSCSSHFWSLCGGNRLANPQQSR